MITWTESNIIIAIIGMVGLLSSAAVMQRSLRANDKHERRLKKNQKPLDAETAERIRNWEGIVFDFDE